jgi:hypothetical protein
MSYLFRVVPKVGPLKAYAMRPPTAETEQLFVKAYEQIVGHYRMTLASFSADTLVLPNVNMDVGYATARGEYGLVDGSYARLLNELERTRFARVSPGLRTDILAFYADTLALATDPKQRTEWKRVSVQLGALRNAQLVAR